MVAFGGSSYKALKIHIKMNKLKKITIGIDATNLNRGGGITHLREVLHAMQQGRRDLDQIIIWGARNTLNALTDAPWILKISPSMLNQGLLLRTLWQKCRLSVNVRKFQCDILFVPGGSYAGNFHPVVCMSRNLLPFELGELKKYGFSFFTLKMLLLRFIQSRSYRRSDGVIFLTEYAQRVVTEITGCIAGATTKIPHGINARFIRAPKLQLDISEYSYVKPYKILYVSIVDHYKHQCSVVEAVSILRLQGFPVVLELVGPAYAPALKKLQKIMSRLDHTNSWVKYYGAVDFERLHDFYFHADLGIFASSCENMPNILLEIMGSGLPIACSNRGPMPEILGDAGIYFDPESPDNIAEALKILINSPQLRSSLSKMSHKLVGRYSWMRCAEETLEFLSMVVQNGKSKNV